MQTETKFKRAIYVWTSTSTQKSKKSSQFAKKLPSPFQSGLTPPLTHHIQPSLNVPKHIPTTASSSPNVSTGQSNKQSSINPVTSQPETHSPPKSASPPMVLSFPPPLSHTNAANSSNNEHGRNLTLKYCDPSNSEVHGQRKKGTPNKRNGNQVHNSSGDATNFNGNVHENVSCFWISSQSSSTVFLGLHYFLQSSSTVTSLV